MNRKDYYKFRDNAYNEALKISKLAEKNKSEELYMAYEQMCKALDAIDELGYKLGFLDPDSNEEI